MFKLEDCIIRLARPSDREDLIEVSRGIWDGHDYLPRIVDRWIAEDWFFVCEYQRRVIACLKLSLFPDNVLWFEGLRVHRKYQGKGIAKLMNRELFRFASGLKATNPELSYEFCTYYENVESLAITRKMGFVEQASFYNMERRGVIKIKEPEIVAGYGMDIFRHYPRYLPLNWHAVHAVESALPFIKEHAIVFKGERGLYLTGSVGERCITLLSDLPTDIKAELPYLQYFFGSRIGLSLTFPTSMAGSISRMQEAKFYFWGEGGEIAQNMLVFGLPE
jgi:GNAT superfamily N-acetyltransferase